MPYAYTEQGVAMLSAVLRSDTAVQVSIQTLRVRIPPLAHQQKPSHAAPWTPPPRRDLLQNRVTLKSSNSMGC